MSAVVGCASFQTKQPSVLLDNHPFVLTYAPPFDEREKSPAEAGLFHLLAKDTYLLVVMCTPGPIVELMEMLFR